MTQPPVSPSDLDDASLALLQANTKSIVSNASRLGLTWNLARATVKSVETTGEVYGIYDGDTAAVRMTNIHTTSLSAGDRIYVLQVPPGGNFIIGPGGSGGGTEGAGVYLWNGANYVLSPDAKLFVGPVNPDSVGTNAAPGSIWFITT